MSEADLCTVVLPCNVVYNIYLNFRHSCCYEEINIAKVF